MKRCVKCGRTAFWVYPSSVRLLRLMCYKCRHEEEQICRQCGKIYLNYKWRVCSKCRHEDV